MDKSQEPTGSDRRDFFKKASTVVLGGIAVLLPMAAGVPLLVDPLRRKSENGEPVRVTTLDALPPDGVPRKFTIISSRSDAWNRYAEIPIGAIYLRRPEPDKVEALNVVCPHAGCFVDYVPARRGFLCPCHNSTFALDGKIAAAKSPTPRAMDSLEAEIRNGNEIWVKFRNFRAGRPEKIPVA